MPPFSAVEMAHRDPIFGLKDQFMADTNPPRGNLGVGVNFTAPANRPCCKVWAPPPKPRPRCPFGAPQPLGKIARL